MDRMKGVWKSVRPLLLRRRVERELAEELRFHVDMEVLDNLNRGMSAEEARRMAMISFGGVERYMERVREARWTRWVEDIAADVKYAIRTMGRRPGFTAAVVATLALGIGGTTSIFSVVDALFLRAPSGVVAPETVRQIYIERDEGNVQTPGGGPGSWVDYRAMRDVPAFEGMAAMVAPRLMDLGRGSDAEQMRVSIVSGGYLQLLGVRPATGRLFTADEDGADGAAPVAVISHALWQRRFGGAADVLGGTLALNGETVQIIGVAQAGFDGTTADAIEVWVPSSMGAALGAMFSGWRESTGMAAIAYLARLAPGVEDEAALAQAVTALRHAAESDAGLDPTPRVLATSLVPAAVPGGSKAADLSLWLALVAGLVLIIACANVANLLLARSIARRRELAVRQSIGAGRWRLTRQHLTESLLLAVLGGAAGVAVTYWAMGMMRQFPLPPSAGRVDARLLVFTLAVSLLAGLLFGVLPALRSTGVDVAEGLRDSRAVGALSRSRTRRALVLVQVSLSLALLVGAGLFIRSLQQVRSIDGGVDIGQLLTISADLGRAGFSPEEREQFYETAIARINTIAGVEGAAIVHYHPYSGMAYGAPWEVPGREAPAGGVGPYLNMAGPGYFEVAGTRVLRGRGFESSDRPGSEPVVVVNEAMARIIADDGDAVGVCMAVRDQIRDGGCSRVIGVVETQRHRYLEEQQVPVIFTARAQAPTMITWGGPTLVVRTSGDPGEHIDAIRAGVQGLRPDLPFITVRPLTEAIRRDVLPFELGATLFTLFGVLALTLAAVGLYGVLAYFVTERTHEIGIRRSLGAPSREVVRLVVRQGMGPVTVGVAIGLVGAFAGTRLLEALLFGVDARDPVVFSGAAVFLLVVGVVAAVVPAARAGRVSPIVALRQDG